MPLQLTTPINTGDLDPNNATYAQVRIIRFTLDSVNKMFELVTQEGNTSGSDWVPGVSRVKRFTLMDVVDAEGNPVAGQQHYTDMVANSMQDATMLVTDPIYDGAAHHLYQWLIDQGHYAGTVV